MPRARISEINPPNTFERLEQRIRIDRDHLERACVEQPDLLYDVAAGVSFRRSQRDELKKALEEYEATQYVHIRRQAANAEERMTEGEVRARMVSDVDHRRITADLGRVNEALLKWEALKEAYLQRSYMLKELVSLYLARYYGDPARSAENRIREVASERHLAARRERNGGE